MRLPYLTVKRGLSKPGGLSLEVRFIHIRERYEVLKLKRGFLKTSFTVTNLCIILSFNKGKYFKRKSFNV